MNGRRRKLIRHPVEEGVGKGEVRKNNLEHDSSELKEKYITEATDIICYIGKSYGG